MSIQIFGTKKCFDTKKAERWFKERGVKCQLIDMKEKGMSRGEFNNVVNAVGGIDNLINDKAKDKDTLTLMKYLTDEDRIEKLFENQQLIITPVVRCGKKAVIGFQPEIWKDWE
ncbi:MAG: arsenate reductase family protein [Ruminococcus sp.]|nr:arsenate reductase family protein [Ruminococcus sp.]MBR6623726.1 arsenate reductase family protein [Ruminococcus sp.]